MGCILVHLSVPRIGTLSIARYIPYRQLIGIPIRYGIQNFDTKYRWKGQYCLHEGPQHLISDIFLCIRSSF